MSFVNIEKLYQILFIVMFASFMTLNLMNASLSIMGVYLIALTFIMIARLVSLNPIKSDASSQGNLSGILVSSITQEQEIQKRFFFKRLMRPDAMMICLIAILLMIWGAVCTYYPNEIGAIKTLHIELKGFFETFYPDHDSALGTPNQMSKILVFLNPAISFLLLTLLLLTLSASRFLIKYSVIIGIIITAVTLVFLTFMNGLVDLFQWPDAYFLKGGGLGAAKVVLLLNPQIAYDSASFFMMRFFDLGFIGAYGAYLLLLPFMALFFDIISLKRRRAVLAYIGLGLTALIILVDLFWLYHPIGFVFFVTNWMAITALAGHLGYKTAHIRR